MRDRRAAAGCLLALMSTVTVLLALVVQDHRRDRDREQRAEQVALVAQQVRGTLVSAAGALESVRGLFAAGPVDRAQFARFTAPILRSQPALDSLSFTARVQPSRRARFSRRLRRPIRAGIRPRGPDADLFPVTFAAGAGERPAALGADVMADPSHAATLTRARDTGSAQASMPARLPRSGRPGLVVSVPVYATGRPRRTVAQRRAALRGFASGVFRVERLAEVVELPAGTAVELAEDGRTVLGEVSDPDAASVTAPFGGRSWSIRLGSIAGASLPVAVAAVLGVGFGLTIAVALLLLAYGRRERYALGLVAQRLAERDEAEDRFRLLAERSSDLITRNTPDGTFEYVSPASLALLGYEPAELVDRSPFPLVHPDDEAALRQAFARLAGDTDASSRAVAARLRRKDGSYAWLESVMHALRDPGSGELLEFHAVTRDISERKRLEGRLRELADHDELTGLHNRRSFNRELTREMAAARRSRTPGALLMLDLDGFKAINDAHGHAAGDRLLVQVAWALRQDLRGEDVVVRLGGDEFAVILPRADAEHGRAVAARILGDLRALTGGRVTASIGLTTYGPQCTAAVPAEVTATADMALYAAKRSGGDQVAEAHAGRPATPAVL